MTTATKPLRSWNRPLTLSSQIPQKQVFRLVKPNGWRLGMFMVKPRLFAFTEARLIMQTVRKASWMPGQWMRISLIMYRDSRMLVWSIILRRNRSFPNSCWSTWMKYFLKPPYSPAGTPLNFCFGDKTLALPGPEKGLIPIISQVQVAQQPIKPVGFSTCRSSPSYCSTILPRCAMNGKRPALTGSPF